MANKFDKIKKVFNIKNTMTLIAPVIMLILLITATGAWFVLSRNAGVNLFSGKVSQWDLVVSDTPGGEPISDGDTLTIGFAEFTNVTSKVMAPGTYGTIDFYIRTTTSVTTDYAVFIDKSGLKFNAYSEDAGTDAKIQEELAANSEMLQKHIRFYMDEDFTKEVNMTEPLTGSIAPNSEDKVTIYWYWLYDGTGNVPSELTDEADIQQFLTQWDMDDCFISDNQDKLEGNIDIHVTASQQKPKER